MYIFDLLIAKLQDPNKVGRLLERVNKLFSFSSRGFFFSFFLSFFFLFFFI